MVISELSEDNASILDGAGRAHEWLEVENRGAAPESLAGWSLTADGVAWPFPAVSVAPAERLVVWCSGACHPLQGALCARCSPR